MNIVRVKAQMVMPFLFQSNDRFYVKIATSEYVAYNAKLMCDSKLGNWCLAPDVGVVKEEQSFETEQEAIEFIRGWWQKH